MHAQVIPPLPPLPRPSPTQVPAPATADATEPVVLRSLLQAPWHSLSKLDGEDCYQTPETRTGCNASPTSNTRLTEQAAAEALVSVSCAQERASGKESGGPGADDDEGNDRKATPSTPHLHVWTTR